MDDLTLLRSIRSEPDEREADAVENGRRKLLLHIATSSGTAAKPRRNWAWPTVASVVAATAVGVLVVGNVVGFGSWRGSASPAAAETLEQAAITALETSDPVVKPGQYLAVSTTAAYERSAWVTAEASDGEQNSLGYFLGSQDHTLYIPADPSAVWVWEREASIPVQTFGPLSEEAAAQSDDGPWAQKQVWTARGGSWGDGGPSPTADSWRQLPTEPSSLLEHIEAVTKGQGSAPEHQVIVWIADALRTGTVPADVRANLYRAAALLSGVAIVTDEVNLDGRTGVAIGIAAGDGGERTEIIIDPRDGQLIGEQVVTLVPHGEIPAGTAIARTAVTTTVVDRPPATTKPTDTN